MAITRSEESVRSSSLSRAMLFATLTVNSTLWLVSVNCCSNWVRSVMNTIFHLESWG